MLIKICGIMTEKDAQVVSDYGADFIGFVFAPSKRRISPVHAAKLAQHVKEGTKIVGVFVNESIENIKYIANLVGLDYIQLHGDETEEFAKKLSFPIIKAFSVDQVSATVIQNYPCDYYLIDSPGEQYRGGSGKVFRWDILDELNIDMKKLILAGGLNINNIQQAIATVHPSGVDVSSGVETDGIKDHHKIKTFIQKVRRSQTITEQ